MWVRGNLHCHTNVSDGDTEPSEVCRLYAEKGYDVLSITDHMALVDPATVKSHGLLLVPGEEMHLSAEEAPKAPLHVNGFGLRSCAVAAGSTTKAQSIQNCIDAIAAAGGIAQINHPNFHYAFDHEVIEGTRDCQLLEVSNGHPAVYNDGDEEHIGVEAMWDHLLTRGRRFFATAVDDAHHFQGERAPWRANPFRGWIWARVERLTVDEVMSALKIGSFYASTGVELEEVEAEGTRLRVVIEPESSEDYRTLYISTGGEVLHETASLDSSFALPDDGKHTYLRAKVVASDGSRAWTQPVFRA